MPALIHTIPEQAHIDQQGQDPAKVRYQREQARDHPAGNGLAPSRNTTVNSIDHLDSCHALAKGLTPDGDLHNLVEASRFWGVGWVEGPRVGVEALLGSVFGERRTLEGLDGEGCYLFAVVVAAR